MVKHGITKLVTNNKPSILAPIPTSTEVHRYSKILATIPNDSSSGRSHFKENEPWCIFNREAPSISIVGTVNCFVYVCPNMGHTGYRPIGSYRSFGVLDHSPTIFQCAVLPQRFLQAAGSSAVVARRARRRPAPVRWQRTPL